MKENKKTQIEENLEELFNLPESSPMIELLRDTIDEAKQNEMVVAEQSNIEPMFSQDVNDDYTYIRNNLRMLIEKGSGALDALVSLAKLTESPRAFEVVSQLMRSLTESNRDLIALQKQMKEMNQIDRKFNKSTPQNVTNALFVGSTEELLKIVKKNQ